MVLVHNLKKLISNYTVTNLKRLNSKLKPDAIVCRTTFGPCFYNGPFIAFISVQQHHIRVRNKKYIVTLYKKTFRIYQINNIQCNSMEKILQSKSYELKHINDTQFYDTKNYSSSLNYHLVIFYVPH